MTQQQIQIKHLARSPLNVRKTDSHAALEELKASILAHGLMQNLVVVPAKKGKFEVIAGGRRLEALSQLQDEGKLSDDYAVPCRVADPSEAAEMSLAENTVREAMHPADEFEAFAELIGKGQTVGQVAQRFGVDEKHVLKRLKLGKVAPQLLAAYRAEEISLESLMSFTVTDDRKRQVSVFKSLQGWQKDNARHIRGCLTESMVKSNSKLAVFVGLDAYASAGGKSKADLFEDTSYLEDGGLLQRLAGEKLQALADELKAEGWGWVEVSLDSDYSFTGRCGRIRATPLGAPENLLAERKVIEAEIAAIDEAINAAWDTDDEEEQERLDGKNDEAQERLSDLDEILKDFVAFDPEQMKVSGCYLTLSHSGKVDIEKGLVKPEDKRKLASTADDDSDEAENPKEKPLYGQTLHNDLAEFRQIAARAEIATHPEIAFDLLVFTVVSSQFDRPVSYGADARLMEHFVSPKVGEAKEERLEALQSTLPLAWMKEKSEAAQFRQFQRLTGSEKLELLAFCTARSLKARLCLEGKHGSDSAFEEALSQTGGDVARYWRPRHDTFLNRIGKAQLLDIGRETLGEDWVRSRSDAKKASLVSQLDTAFANPDKYEPDVGAKLRAWLPAGMTFRTLEAEAHSSKGAIKGHKVTQAA